MFLLGEPIQQGKYGTTAVDTAQRSEFLPIHIRQVGENIPAVGVPFLGGEVFVGHKLVPCNIDLPGGIYRLLRKLLPVGEVRVAVFIHRDGGGIVGGGV